MVKPDGTLQARYQWDAWGNERRKVGVSFNPFGFTGHELDDETGLYYAKHRFYDPEVGRFLTEDPVFGELNDPPSLHAYTYGKVNPLVWVDPDGRQEVANDPLGLSRPRSIRAGEELPDGAQVAFEQDGTIFLTYAGDDTADGGPVGQVDDPADPAKKRNLLERTLDLGVSGVVELADKFADAYQASREFLGSVKRGTDRDRRAPDVESLESQPARLSQTSSGLGHVEEVADRAGTTVKKSLDAAGTGAVAVAPVPGGKKLVEKGFAVVQAATRAAAKRIPKRAAVRSPADGASEQLAVVRRDLGEGPEASARTSSERGVLERLARRVIM